MTSDPTKPKRRWWRLLTQFSLRTLLVLTTLAAAGCWWFLQPEAREEELAGPYLKLRRQVRVQKPPAGAAEDADWTTNVGAWRVTGEHGDLLIDGRYADNQPHGKWTIYHVNGKRAVEGTVFCGARTGVWRTWDEQGTLRSEVTYQAVERPYHPPPTVRPFVSSPIPVVGMIDFLPLAQFGGGMMGGGGMPPVVYPSANLWDSTHISLRHGPAKVWYASGQLRIEGGYQEDLRDGPWTYYDEQGQITEQGAFRAGVREGPWKTRGSGSEKLLTAQYVVGIPRPQLDELLVQLEGDLTGGSIHRKLAAARRLEEIGPPALPCLLRALESADAETQLLSLRALARQQALPAEALTKIAPFTKHAEPRLAQWARLAIYLSDPAERPKLFAQLMAGLQSAGDERAIETLLTMYHADSERQLAILHALIERGSHTDVFFHSSSTYWLGPVGEIADLGWDVIPQLNELYPQFSAESRVLTVQVLHELVARGKPSVVDLPTGGREIQWTIPEQGQPLLERAQADTDPRVRETAAAVGKQPAWNNWGVSGGGFF